MLRTYLLVLTCLSAAAAAQDDPGVQWLAEHAIRLQSIDPTHSDLDDLEPLRAVIGDARIVQLGEPSHGDGAAFLTKTRIVRFLHERMGFDVLAFESGLYDCRVAWQRLQAGDDPHAAMAAGVFPIWMDSQQVQPLADYLAAQAKARQPLELCGFDFQFTGTATRERLAAELGAVLAAARPPVGVATAAVLERLAARMDAPDDVPAADHEPALAALAALAHGLGEPGAATSIGARGVAFWRQLANSWRAFLQYRWHPAAGSLAATFNPRDAQMADNLRWLARDHHPRKRIIVWAATMHIQRNADTIDTRSTELDYAGLVPMGHLVAAALGDGVVTLGFLAYEGRAGLPWGTPWSIPPAPTNSLEDLCARAKLDNAIVSFRGLPADHWLRQPRVARPLGYTAMVADWTSVLDGVVFNRVMTPSRHRISAAERAATQDLGALLDEQWREITARTASGSVWADKTDFVNAWDTRWRTLVADADADAEPDAARIAQEQQRVLQWAAPFAGQPGFEWRLQQLLACMAASGGDRKAARAAMAKAIAAHPDTPNSDPARYGKFQHLVNQQAGWICDDDGLDAAIDYVVGLLQDDPRMRYFFASPWQQRLSSPLLQAMLARVTTAYAERARRLPQFADEARRFARELR